jgi:hypothetical protein
VFRHKKAFHISTRVPGGTGVAAATGDTGRVLLRFQMAGNRSAFKNQNLIDISIPALKNQESFLQA